METKSTNFCKDGGLSTFKSKKVCFFYLFKYCIYFVKHFKGKLFFVFQEDELKKLINEDAILSMLAENRLLKNQIDRMHAILKAYPSYPEASEYLTKYNIQ